MSVNTQDMEIVHRALRRESRLLTELVAAVAPGDTARAKVIAGHFRVYQVGLKNHHEGEDELLWPPLLSRVDLEADIVLRMEAQHERIAATLTRLDTAVPVWEATAGADERDTLVAALAEHRAVLLEHLDDEESALLPLAAEYITERNGPPWATTWWPTPPNSPCSPSSASSWRTRTRPSAPRSCPASPHRYAASGTSSAAPATPATSAASARPDPATPGTNANMT